MSIKEEEKLEKEENLIISLPEIPKISHGKRRHKKELSIYLKIILNYLQMIGFIRSLNIKWPFYADNYVKSLSFFSDISSNVFSIDCLIFQYDIQGNTLHLKAIFSSFLLLFSFLIFLTIISFKFAISHYSYFTKIILAFFIISMFLHPIIIQSLFENLICIDIDGNRLLEKQLNLECDSSNHMLWVLNFSFFLNNYFSIDLLFCYSITLLMVDYLPIWNFILSF